jgi:alkylation response protein AidB-like acyl-CoA dehydrogenase
MSSADGTLIRETLRAFRKKRVVPEWDRLNAPDATRYLSLWAQLRDLGVTGLGLPEGCGGVDFDARSRFDVACELGAAVPALAFGLISHAIALALLVESSNGHLADPLASAATGERFALVGSPLDRVPETAFEIRSNGALRVSGSQRVGLAFVDWIVLAAREGGHVRLCVLRAGGEGVAFAGAPSGHGLRLVPFGELVCDDAPIPPEHVLPWPSSGRTANEADGLVAAVLAGMSGEMAERSMRYALHRYQGGKMIHEHDAVKQLTGPIELTRRCVQAVALAALAQEGPGDGGASAFAVDLVRRSGLDAIQTFGGYGYMEDFGVERYLRDANTLETAWIHAAARVREIARARYDQMGGPA